MTFQTLRQTTAWDAFDAVVMLTWSDWKSEPRSNRYHYATRFAVRIPTVFVQPDAPGELPVWEDTDEPNLRLLRVPNLYDEEHIQALLAALRGAGIVNPLLWVYSPNFEPFINRSNARLRIYHATEDYLGPTEGVRISDSEIIPALKRTLKAVDMVVAVSQGVADSYRKYGEFEGPILVLPNGCDFAFWDRTGASHYTAPPSAEKVALFQGGINQRLDFDLLSALADRMPDWQFWFCGKSTDGGAPWHALKERPNVRDFGFLSPEGIAELAQQSLVGLIPFKQDALMRRSLPLKAYEYLACGLPVVSVPIDSLAGQSGLFGIAETVDGFSASIAALAPTRTDERALSSRREAARRTSYDLRFDELETAIEAQLARRRTMRPRLNALMLYDDRSTHVGTIREHLEAFQKYSRHNFLYMPATGMINGVDGEERALDLGVYDALLIHYSVRVSLADHLSPGLARAVASYAGPKLLFIQDEYDETETARRWIERLGITAVFTNVPGESLSKVYPPERFPNVDFLPTLTGYVPEDAAIESFITPLEQRNVLIGYRGRQLPHQYGALGNDKLRIGVEMKRLAAERGHPVDIEVDDGKRIYGLDWYRFMGSVRATLGTESGANVFDFDGHLAKLAAKHKSMPYGEFAERYLGPHENLVRMNQISPKIFEAIRLRTALVLFEGSYSGVVAPGRHYIPLKPDFSNVDEVFSKINDISYLRSMTEAAYREIIESGKYSYSEFIKIIDSYIDDKAFGRRRAEIVSVPLMAVYAGADAVPLWTERASSAVLNSVILDRRISRERLVELAETQIDGRRVPASVQSAEIVQNVAAGVMGRVAGGVAFVVRPMWRRLPAPSQRRFVGLIKQAASNGSNGSSVPVKLLRGLWRTLPTKVRARILTKLR